MVADGKSAGDYKTPANSQPPGNLVWEAQDFRRNRIGWLVTSPAGINHPLGLVPAPGYTDSDEERRAYNTAVDFARDPSSILRAESMVLDLRKSGTEEGDPMPGLIFGLTCFLIADAAYVESKEPPPDSEGEAHEPQPYCWHRLLNLVDDHAKRVFTPEERQAFPWPRLSLGDRSDVMGSHITTRLYPAVPVEVDPQSWEFLTETGKKLGLAPEECIIEMITAAEMNEPWTKGANAAKPQTTSRRKAVTHGKA